MSRLRIWALAAVVVIAPQLTFAQSTTSRSLGLTMETVMSKQELRETGVASLSPSQRKALDAWLNRYTQRVARAVASMAAARSHPTSIRASTPAPPSNCSPAIETQIDGDFNGWEGDTIFKLANGQIWEQAEYDYEYEYDFMPAVVIYGASDGCRMKVEGMDDTILVKRIK